MPRFSIRTEDHHEVILGQIMKERGFNAKSKAITWLIENYSKFEEMANEVARLRWEKAAGDTRLGNIIKALNDKAAAEQKLLKLCQDGANQVYIK